MAGSGMLRRQYASTLPMPFFDKARTRANAREHARMSDPRHANARRMTQLDIYVSYLAPNSPDERLKFKLNKCVKRSTRRASNVRTFEREGRKKRESRKVIPRVSHRYLSLSLYSHRRVTRKPSGYGKTVSVVRRFVDNLEREMRRYAKETLLRARNLSIKFRT